MNNVYYPFRLGFGLFAFSDYRQHKNNNHITIVAIRIQTCAFCILVARAFSAASCCYPLFFLRGMAAVIVDAGVFGSVAAEQWFLQLVASPGPVLTELEAMVKRVVAKEASTTGGNFVVAIKENIFPDGLLASTEANVEQILSTEGNGLYDKFKTVDKHLVDAQNILKELKQIDNLLNADMEWRVFEKSCDRKVWATAWDRVLVKVDAVDQQAELMGDPSVANTMTVLIQNPESELAKKLMDSITFKKAKRASWETLCIKPEGGMDRLRGFLADQICASEDKAVVAVAQKMHALLLCLEAQLVESEVESSGPQIIQQREAIMPLVLHTILAMRRTAKKASAQKPADLGLLRLDFSIPWTLALSAMSLHKSAASSPAYSSAHAFASSSGGGNEGVDWSNNGAKRARTSFAAEAGGTYGPVSSADAVAAAHRALGSISAEPKGKGKLSEGKASMPKGGKGKAASGLAAQTKASKAELEAHLSSVVASGSYYDIKNFVDKGYASQDPATVSAIRQLMGDYCRHCIMNAKGMFKHSRKECKTLGNEPGYPCSSCGNWGHWPEDCP